MTQIQQKYHPIEQTIRDALQSLASVCDGADKRDSQGFNGGDANSPFIKSILARDWPYTPNQLRSAYEIIKRYPRQLAGFGIEIPQYEEVKKLADQKQVEYLERQRKKDLEDQAAQYGSRFLVKYHHERLWVTFPWADKKRFDQFRDKVAKHVEQAELGYRKPKWSEDETLGWELIATNKMLNLFLECFPKAQLDEKAEAFRARLEQIQREKMQRIAEQKADWLKEYYEIMDLMGDLEQEIAPGTRYYEHQVQAIQMACFKQRSIIADKMGAGKTLSAMGTAIALQKKYGVKIIVLTKKNIRSVWLRWAEKLGIDISVYTIHEKIIPTPAEDWPEYFLICDEAHLFQTWSSKRTQKMVTLALHRKCRGVVHCTGTPSPNGRPKELYPLLFTCKFPPIWSDNPDPEKWAYEVKTLKKWYDIRYCNGHLEEMGGNRFWDNNGAKNQLELNQMMYYRPDRDDNHEYALMIQRTKEECVDLPEKERVMHPAEISAEAQTAFAQMLVEKVEQFETNKEAKVEEYKEKLALQLQENERIKIESGEDVDVPWQDLLEQLVDKKEQLIEAARALALQTAYRQASAIAKIDETMSLTKDLLAQGEKVVIFTHFKETARIFKQRLEEECAIKVGTVLGGQKQQDTDAMVDAFQDPGTNTKVMICSEAGGEGITLTAASYLIINDRAWTPGKSEQEEDRIHRIGTQYKCTVLWVQVPKEICETDVRVDNILLEKDLDINLLIRGEKTNTLKFLNDVSVKSILKDAAKFKKQLKSKKAASAA